MKKRLSFILVGVVGLGTLFFVNSASEEKNVEANYVSFGEIANQVYGSDANSLNKASINTLKIKEPLDLIINEQRFSASYLTKLHLLKGNATEDEAKEDAFKSLITEAAIFEQASSSNLLPNDNEIQIYIKEIRSLLSEKNPENAASIDTIYDIIKNMNMTEEEYFQKFAYNLYFIQLANNNLYQQVTANYPEDEKEKKWAEYSLSTTNNYIQNNAFQLNEFANSHNIVNWK